MQISEQPFPVGIRQGFHLLNNLGIIFRFHALASPFVIFAPGSGSNITGCCNTVSVLADFSVF
nr:MAG TPA: hypothetical protein [Caudoviricetes sp.]